MTGKVMWLAMAVAVAVTALMAVPAVAQESSDPLITPPQTTPEVYTLQDMLHDGGVILWVIMVLGFLTLVLAIYLFLTVTPRRETSDSLFKRLVAQLRGGDLRGAYQMCEGRRELLPRVVFAGLKVHGHDRYVIQEAMESEGERGATALWQRISYLNNVGVIAPLLGLLGTVWGMIGAFTAIASDNAQVKGIAMASKVSQAMITTAAGLVLAIPAMVAYFYLRGQVTRIVADVEAQASEIVELLSRGDQA